jgi:L-2-hydroxyglutarate oxidase LhgO
MSSPPRVVIIGGGIVGLATAFKLGRKLPSAQITLLEKEAEVCRHQSGNNSGVLHAGLYYKPGSTKARLAVSGIQEMNRVFAASTMSRMKYVASSSWRC